MRQNNRQQPKRMVKSKQVTVSRPRVVYNGQDVTDFVQHLYDECRYTNIFKVLKPLTVTREVDEEKTQLITT